MGCREVRLFKTLDEVVEDFKKYPRYGKDDINAIEGDRYMLVNKTLDYKVDWLAEDVHDIQMAICGLEISSLFIAYGVSHDAARYAVTRVRKPR